ncbi:MFS transporter [Parasphingorhabdus halotolerans]|uniref:MFS transporter n=1 Tax=Parasphingorhabdus halotolerans TaxID=2725558 RepID=A0A6H2DPL0_9SPHN|nr:MFS transporter [Parasphingorhabdus halotolerans]QJB70274.1 MFS transporter [Parasphingorhabdus halotolerans]
MQNLHAKTDSLLAASSFPKSLALTENRALRYACYFLLYFSQGAPIGLWTIAVPTWLAVNGASAGEIGGFIGLAMLPWATFKLFYGAFMDRYTFPPMGRKRIWLVAAQAGAILSLIVLAILAPGMEELALLTAIAFFMNVAITIQDAAIDGIAVDVTPEEQRVTANSVMFAGQIIGTGVAAAVAGLLLKYYGIGAVGLCFAAFLAVVLTIVILVRERPGERMLPWTAGKASAECIALNHSEWLPLLKDLKKAFFQPRVFFFVPAFMSTGAIYAALDVGGPIFASQVLQWDETGYSSLAGIAGIVAGLLCVLVLGAVTRKIGATLTGSSLFVVLALASLVFSMLKPAQLNDLSFQIYVFVHVIFAQAMFIIFCAAAMNMCLNTISATQFSLLVATSSMARVVSSSLMGGVYDWGGVTGFWNVITLASLFGLVTFLVFSRIDASVNRKKEI